MLYENESVCDPWLEPKHHPTHEVLELQLDQCYSDTWILNEGNAFYWKGKWGQRGWKIEVALQEFKWPRDFW